MLFSLFFSIFPVAADLLLGRSVRTKRATAPARLRDSERQRSRKRRGCACVADCLCTVVHESKYLGGAWGNFGEEQEDRYERGRRLGR